MNMFVVCFAFWMVWQSSSRGGGEQEVEFYDVKSGVRSAVSNC